MSRAWVRSLLGSALPLALGALLGWWLVVGAWSWSPVVLSLLLAGSVLLGEAVRSSRPRESLEAELELQDGLSALAELAGVRLCGVSVSAEPVPVQGGEVVFTTVELERHELSGLLSLGARQLAAMTAPPVWSLWGLLCSGAGLGLLLGLRERWGNTLVASLLAMLGLAVLAALVIWRSGPSADRRSQAIEARARELLGQLRDARPELFRDLTERQGLEPGPAGRQSTDS